MVIPKRHAILSANVERGDREEVKANVTPR
jgi:hypothetical protein